jgi:hypothetical protein
MGGFSESDLVVLTNTLSQDLSDYVGPGVELVVSPVINVVAPGTQFTCLYNFRLPMLSLAREIPGATYNVAFRTFFVPGPTLTFWRFANLPHRTL